MPRPPRQQRPAARSSPGFLVRAGDLAAPGRWPIPDNPAVNGFVRGILGHYYGLVTSEDGLEMLTLARRPDARIDLLLGGIAAMPEMGVVELARATLPTLDSLILRNDG